MDVAAALILSLAGDRDQRLIVKKLLRFSAPGLAVIAVLLRRATIESIRAGNDKCIQEVLLIVTYLTQITTDDGNQNSIISVISAC